MKRQIALKQTEIGMIPEDWEIKTLGEFISIKHGFAFKGEFFSDVPNENILLTPGNFHIGGGFKSDKFKYYTGSYPEEYVLKENDLIVTMTDLSKEGDTLGYSALIPKGNENRFLHNQRLGLVILKSKSIDKAFLYWVLRTRNYHIFVVNTSSGSTVKHTAPTRIYDYKFALPKSVEEQQSIAKILSDLDSKLELNQQMNTTLEKVGQILFKHWFIDFEFPNEKGKPYKSSGGEMVDSDLGEIPKGWDIRPFSEVIAVSPRRQLTKGSVAKKVSMADLERWQSWITSWSREEYRGGSVFKNSDTLFARITPCLEQGKTAFVSFLDHEEVAFGSTEFIVLSPKFIKSPALIFFLSRSTKFRDEAIMSMTGTSGRQRVPNEVFDKYLIACPPDRLMDTFDKLVGPMMVMINNNALELTSLGAIRDSLLPKLMSGQIRVPAG